MRYIPYIFGLLLGIALTGHWFQYQTISELRTALGDTRAVLEETRTQLAHAQTDISRLQGILASTTDELLALGIDKSNLASALESERDRNNEFREQIEDINDTVEVLDKLSKTDKELLQKYSRVYFLNENFVPESLTEIDKEYQYDESRTMHIHTKVEPFLKKMLEAAEDDGVNLWIVSAYRSFDEQQSLKTNYLMVYGSGANAFSADQGYSEHQLGTTVDFTTNGLGGGLSGFGNTEAFRWLEKNAHEYGFILSYPQGNAYYEYEPWHWRFVGEDLADDLHDDDISFYDLEQRELDAYLVTIFD